MPGNLIIMYIYSRHRQWTLANCEHDINICDSKIQVSSVKNILVSHLVILSAGMLSLVTLLKSVFLIYSYCQE